MEIKERLSGNEAAAVAIRQINPDVIAAFPITPSTEIPQYVSEYLAHGKIDTEFVAVESEHSSMSACIGACSAGARSMTATSSCGLALMFEMLYVAASCRLPITMACVNRALSGPININNDHSDSMGARDCGWLQLYAENAQEAYDNMIMGVRIAEHKKVLLPIMNCQDGFITSHAIANLSLLEDDVVKKFVGDYCPDKYLLNKDECLSVGAYDIVNYYMEHKKLQAVAMQNALTVAKEVFDDFYKISGRQYDLIEEFCMEDAEYAMVIIGSSAGTAKQTVLDMRKQGHKVGLVKIRVFRPFPQQQIHNALKNVKGVAIMDKAESFNACGGPLTAEVKAAMYGLTANVKSVIYGIGGRDFNVDSAREVFEKLQNGTLPDYYYLSVREEL